MKMKFDCEFRHPPSAGSAPGTAKVAFRWTTPEVSSLDAAKKAARARAEKSGYTVRAINFRAEKGKAPSGLVVYVVKGK